MKRTFAALLALSLILTGCARLTSIHRETLLDAESKAIAIDAKQRVVITSRVSETKNNYKRQFLIACAEPSPDALSVISAALSGNVEVPEKVATSLTNAINETGSNIGLRTQSIQLLRDAMYRLCEGYMGGALSDVEFQQLQRRYRDVMVALLAIEQLTGAVRPSQAVLGGRIASEAAENLSKAQQRLEESRVVEEQASANAATVKTKYDADQKAAKEARDKANAAPSDTGLAQEAERLEGIAKESQEALRKATIAETEAKSNRAAYENIRNAARLGDVAASSVFELEQQRLKAADMSKITSTVERIVAQVITQDYSKEVCLSVMSAKDRDFTTTVGEQIALFCQKLLAEKAVESEVRTRQLNRQLQLYK